MPIPNSVLKLIETFQIEREKYHSDSFNETDLRINFLDPFFDALGWDVSNTVSQRSVERRDVSHGWSMNSAADSGLKTTKVYPDYAFRIGEVSTDPVFFAEAKRPSVNIHTNREAAFQTRAYGWNAKLPFCILTDFEEFAIYDCRSAPQINDGSNIARVDYFKCDQYAEKWEMLEALFGREAVKAGALEKRALQEQRKGSKTVDAFFLEQINRWRELLANDLVAQNSQLTGADLNFVVQMTIDRLIFLRMAEDRDLEPWGTLRDISRSGKNVYSQLLERFHDADDRYNSGLFHEKRSGCPAACGGEE